MRLVKILLVSFLIFNEIALIKAQDNNSKNVFTLNDVVQVALNNSPDARSSKNRFKNSYWKYRSFKSNNLPLVNMEATLPDLNRTISRFTLDDGSIAFIESQAANSDLSININQNIGFTGGNLFVKSGVERIDLLGSNKSISYLTNPILIGYSQPLFSFNAWRWNKKIEPILFNEAQKKQIEDLEDVSIKATNLFFDLLSAQINLAISITNKANNDTLYKIAKGRYNLGKIAENELLQMELSVLNANTALDQVKLDVENANLKLKSFLGLKGDLKIELLIPVTIPAFEVDIPKAIEFAKNNSQEFLSYNRQLIEADRDVMKARMENRYDVNFFAMYGLTKQSNSMDGLYDDPSDYEKFRFGVQVPVFDWGRSKAQVKMAEANRDMIKTNIEQQIMDYDQSVYLKMMQFNMQRNQLFIAKKADTIAQKRYDVTKQRYMIGKIVITDLNIALAEKDESKRSFVEALRNYWISYYEIRKTTHFDFENNQMIQYSEDVD